MVMERDDYRCIFCNERRRDELHVDHVRPLSMGGTNDLYNLQTLCHFCGQMKMDEYPYTPPEPEEIWAMQKEMGGVFRKNFGG
jgi:5-methylcytosine-specific restriction endonuclease McrA